MAVVATSAAANAQTHGVSVDLGIAGSDLFVNELDRGGEAVTVYDYKEYSDTRSPLVSLSLSNARGEPGYLGVRDRVFGIDGPFTPTYQCGQERSRSPLTCSVTPGGAPTAAPEIDSRFATEGVLLLAGSLIVLRAGRRAPKAQSVG
jgi:hypothetical protein